MVLPATDKTQLGWQRNKASIRLRNNALGEP